MMVNIGGTDISKWPKSVQEEFYRELAAEVEEHEYAPINVFSAEYARQLIGDTPNIRFTGWKLDRAQQRAGACAQWLDDDKRMYVNIPGMECGIFDESQPFDIGTARIYQDTDRETVTAYILAGYLRLLGVEK